MSETAVPLVDPETLYNDSLWESVASAGVIVGILGGATFILAASFTAYKILNTAYKILNPAKGNKDQGSDGPSWAQLTTSIAVASVVTVGSFYILDDAISYGGFLGDNSTVDHWISPEKVKYYEVIDAAWKEAKEKFLQAVNERNGPDDQYNFPQTGDLSGQDGFPSRPFSISPDRFAIINLVDTKADGPDVATAYTLEIVSKVPPAFRTSDDVKKLTELLMRAFGSLDVGAPVIIASGDNQTETDAIVDRAVANIGLLQFPGRETVPAPAG